jgi:hypothetical protein
MTEQIAPEATTEAKPLDPMVKMVQDTVTAQIEQANGLVQQINAATTDKGKLVHDIRTDPNSTDEEVKAFQAWFEQAQAAIEARVAKVDEHIKANLMPKSEDVDVEALKAQHKSLKESVKAALTFVSGLPAYDADSFKVPDLANLRGGTSAGTGTGGKRPRLNRIWVDGTLIEKKSTNAKGEEVMVSNFTLAAAHIAKVVGAKVEVKDLQAAAFSAAGTDDLSTVGGKVFDYYFEAGTDEKRKNFKIEVEPKGDTDAETSDAPETETEAEVTPAEVTPAE